MTFTFRGQMKRLVKRQYPAEVTYYFFLILEIFNFLWHIKYAYFQPFRHPLNNSIVLS